MLYYLSYFGKFDEVFFSFKGGFFDSFVDSVGGIRVFNT